LLDVRSDVDGDACGEGLIRANDKIRALDTPRRHRDDPTRIASRSCWSVVAADVAKGRAVGQVSGGEDGMDKKDDRIGSTGTYRVRGVSRDLHRAARLRAVSQGTTLRRVVLQALQAYNAGTWTPPDEPRGSRTNGI